MDIDILKKCYIPDFQMCGASQMRTTRPQTAYEERDTSAPYWKQLATQQSCGDHHQKDIWIGYQDEL